MNSFTNYAMAADATIQSAIYLFGHTSKVVIAVSDAWEAVNVFHDSPSPTTTPTLNKKPTTDFSKKRNDKTSTSRSRSRRRTASSSKSRKSQYVYIRAERDKYEKYERLRRDTTSNSRKR